MVGSAAGQRQSLWMRRRMREGEKQVEKEEEKKEKEEENHPKENKEGENEEEKAAGTEVKCIGGVELEEKKTDFDSRKEKRDDKTLAEKQKSEIQSLDEGRKSRKSHSGEVGKFGNKSVLTKADESNDGEEEEEEEKERKKEKEEEEEGGVGISLALAIASRSVWPHLTG